MTVTITRNDDIRLSTTLKENGSAKNVSAATNITAAIVSTDGNTQYAQSAALSSGETGADWANGIVVVVIPAASTGTLPKGQVTLEIQVTLSSEKTTWYDDSILSRHGSIA